MFCPNCEAEYRAGFTHCADCDVDLVDSLGEVSSAKELQNTDLTMPELLWSGVDNGTLEQLREALDHASIPYNDQTLEARLLYASMRHPLEIWVQRQDLQAAKETVASLFAPSEADLQESETGALAPPPPPESDLRLPAETEATDDSDGDEEDDQNQFEDPPVVQVWSGDQPDMARILKDCLRESGLRSNIIHEEAGKLGLWVHEKIEERAKQIVREVLNATPPE